MDIPTVVKLSEASEGIGHFCCQVPGAQSPSNIPAWLYDIT